MLAARPRVLNDFPYPVAYPYSLIFDEGEPPSNQRWGLCFTEYQLLPHRLPAAGVPVPSRAAPPVGRPGRRGDQQCHRRDPVPVL